MLLSAVATASAVTSEAGKQPYELFKAFISSPPVITKAVFRYREYQGSPAKFVDRFFDGRWQSNAFFLREFKNPNEVSSTKPTMANGFLVGNYSNKYWVVQALGGQVKYWSDEHKPTEVSNIVFRTTKAGKNYLQEALNMGLYQTPISSIRWEGNNFHFPGPGAKVVGSIHVTPSGQVDKLDVTYNDRSHYEIDYEYNPNTGPDYLPSAIKCYYLRQDTRKLLSEFEFLSLTTGETYLAETAFSPDPFFAVTGVQKFYVMNKDLVYQDHGKIEKVLSAHRLPGAITQTRRIYVWVVILGLAFAFFALLFRTQQNKFKPINSIP